MNVGMLACYDQAKETVAKLLNDPMIDGPALPTQIGASLVAVSNTELRTSLPFRTRDSKPLAHITLGPMLVGFHSRGIFDAI